jgi:hypothetical protein
MTHEQADNVPITKINHHRHNYWRHFSSRQTQSTSHLFVLRSSNEATDGKGREGAGAGEAGGKSPAKIFSRL